MLDVHVPQLQRALWDRKKVAIRAGKQTVVARSAHEWKARDWEVCERNAHDESHAREWVLYVTCMSAVVGLGIFGGMKFASLLKSVSLLRMKHFVFYVHNPLVFYCCTSLLILL